LFLLVFDFEVESFGVDVVGIGLEQKKYQNQKGYKILIK